MLTEILCASFVRARDRFALIFLDIVWKAVWLACSAGAALFVAAWFGARLRDLAWEDTGVRATNMLIAAAAARGLWQAMGGEVLLAVFSLVAASAICWYLLEAFVRSGVIGKMKMFFVYLMARVMKTTVLAITALILFLVCLERAPLLAGIIFLAFMFCLSIIETLIRADAVELLGTDLIRVAALIGILMSVEMMIVASLVVILAAGFLNAAGLGEAVVMLGATGISALILSVSHSYLLLVRFSAVDIVRQNVVAV